MIAAMFPGESAVVAGPQGKDDALRRARRLCDAPPSTWRQCEQQTRIYEVSASLWDRVSSRLGFSMMAGHSLGFYAALYGAGALGREEGREVIVRADAAIREVSSGLRGGMSAVVGVGSPRMEEICGRIEGVYVANINAGNQVVISGTDDGLTAAEDAALEEGAFLVRRLAVNAPLHSPLLEGIEDLMDGALGGIRIADPLIPVVNHIAPGLLHRAEQVRDVLRAQFTSKVLWRDAVLFMVESGVGTFVELGPSDVLSKIVRWIRRDVIVFSADEAVGMEGVTGDVCHGEGCESAGVGDVRT
ncbi:MAG: ACP S-malonyltransferase [Thermodesulfovibrionales bacterium]